MCYEPYEVVGDPSAGGPFVFTCEHATHLLPRCKHRTVRAEGLGDGLRVDPVRQREHDQPGPVNLHGFLRQFKQLFGTMVAIFLRAFEQPD